MTLNKFVTLSFLQFAHLYNGNNKNSIHVIRMLYELNEGIYVKYLGKQHIVDITCVIDKETYAHLIYCQLHILVEGHWAFHLPVAFIVLTLAATHLLICFQISPLGFLTNVEELISISCLHFSRV